MPAEEVSFAEKVADIYLAPPGKWVYESVYYEIAGDFAAEWYREKGDARRTKLLSAVKEKDASLTRRAVFGRSVRIEPTIPKDLAALLPKNYSFELPWQTVVRPCMVATIIGESEKRFKVRDATSINRNSTFGMGLTIQREEYVEREYLMLDNVTDADIAKIASFDEEYAREVEEIGQAAAKELIPILARMTDRLAQKKGQQKDMLAELLESLKSTKA
jgi:hypothetical protein